MLAGTKFLIELVDSGKLTVSMEDIKGKPASTRKLLYSLGAYKGVKMSSEFQHYFGIRRCKKLIDDGTSLEDPLLAFIALHKHRIATLTKIGFPMVDIMLEASRRPWQFKSMSKYVEVYNVVKGKDLFLPGLGGFNIPETIDVACKDYAHRLTFPSMDEIRFIGYFGQPEGYGRAEAYAKTLSHLDCWKWVKDTKFPITRLDELKDAYILGLWDNRRKLSTTLATLNNIVERSLQLSWKDDKVIEYRPGTKMEVDDFQLPKNGIDMKKQAKVFSNCSGSYVDRLLAGSTLIAYSKDIMVEFNYNGDITQALGPRNLPISRDSYDRVREIVARFIQDV